MIVFGRMQLAEERIWWRKTRWLAAAVLVIWAFFGVAVQAFDASPWLGRLSGLPLGYLLAELVAPIVTALVLFAFVGRQKRIDRRHGFGED